MYSKTPFEFDAVPFNCIAISKYNLHHANPERGSHNKTRFTEKAQSREAIGMVRMPARTLDSEVLFDEPGTALCYWCPPAVDEARRRPECLFC